MPYFTPSFPSTEAKSISFIGKRIGWDCCFVNLSKHFFLAVPNDLLGYLNPVLFYSAKWIYFPSACCLLVDVQSCWQSLLSQCQAMAFLQLSLEQNKKALAEPICLLRKKTRHGPGRKCYEFESIRRTMSIWLTNFTLHFNYWVILGRVKCMDMLVFM